MRHLLFDDSYPSARGPQKENASVIKDSDSLVSWRPGLQILVHFSASAKQFCFRENPKHRLTDRLHSTKSGVCACIHFADDPAHVQLNKLNVSVSLLQRKRNQRGCDEMVIGLIFPQNDLLFPEAAAARLSNASR